MEVVAIQRYTLISSIKIQHRVVRLYPDMKLDFMKFAHLNYKTSQILFDQRNGKSANTCTEKLHQNEYIE